jgi:hypothetical protein
LKNVHVFFLMSKLVGVFSEHFSSNMDISNYAKLQFVKLIPLIGFGKLMFTYPV